MKISSLLNLINKFSYLVKNAALMQSREYMVLKKIVIPVPKKEGDDKNRDKFLSPGTPLFIEGFESKVIEGLEKKVPIWTSPYDSIAYNLDESKLLNLREFFSKVAKLLPGGTFIGLAHGAMKEFEISADDGKLEITVSFDPKINISIVDNRGIDGGKIAIDNIYKEETSKKDPSKKYSVMSLEALEAFSDPRKFLDFIGVRPELNSRNLLDPPSTILDSEE